LTEEHCVTEDIIVDVLKKPVQGHKSQIFRDITFNGNGSNPALQYTCMLGNSERKNIVLAE